MIDDSAFFSPFNLSVLFHTRISKSRAVGLDGVRHSKFVDHLQDEITTISKRALDQSYRFTPYKEKLILRGFDRIPRQLSIPTVRDRLTLRALCEALNSQFPEASPKPPHAIIKDVIEFARGTTEPHSFVRIDIKDFYPSIPHIELEETLKHLGLGDIRRSLVAKAIRTPTGTNSKPPTRGVPQGLSISTALASLYLQSLDALEAKKPGKYYRYVDDVLIICPSHQATKRLKEVVSFLEKRGLRAHLPGTTGKTEICSVDEGIEYLGYRLRPDRISIRDSSYKRMFKSLQRVITDYRYTSKAERAQFRLNLKITGCFVDGKRRGWLMFFAQTEDRSQLAFLDRFVSDQLAAVKFPTAEFPIKKFIKSYHEIRFKGSASSYLTNFDTFEQDKKAKFIALMKGVSEEAVMTWDIATIQSEYSKIVSREINDMELDLGSIS